MSVPVKRVAILFTCLSVFFLFATLAAAAEEPAVYEDENLRVRLIIRTPEQLAAFYIGRGFNQQAISKIQETCFITAIINNKNVEVLWLELDNWKFSRKSTPLTRITRQYWKKQWQEIGLPLNHQSTFGWTLLPEVRDLRRHEGVGGNVVIPEQNEPFDLSILFKTGLDKKGKVKKISFHHVMCGTSK